MDFRTPCTLAEKIAALKLSKQAFPLAAFLTIYLKAEQECNLNYMEGAYALYNWLTYEQAPLSTPILEQDLVPVPKLFHSWQLVYLAKIVCDYESHYRSSKLFYTEKLIYNTVIRIN
jgi:hypothetical protein